MLTSRLRTSRSENPAKKANWRDNDEDSDPLFDVIPPKVGQAAGDQTLQCFVPPVSQCLGQNAGDLVFGRGKRSPEQQKKGEFVCKTLAEQD